MPVDEFIPEWHARRPLPSRLGLCPGWQDGSGTRNPGGTEAGSWERLDHILEGRLPLCTLNEHDLAFELLDKLCAERFGILIYLKTYPAFDNLRGDPGFGELSRRIGLPR